MVNYGGMEALYVFVNEVYLRNLTIYLVLPNLQTQIYNATASDGCPQHEVSATKGWGICQKTLKWRIINNSFLLHVSRYHLSERLRKGKRAEKWYMQSETCGMSQGTLVCKVFCYRRWNKRE